RGRREFADARAVGPEDGTLRQLSECGGREDIAARLAEDSGVLARLRSQVRPLLGLWRDDEWADGRDPDLLLRRVRGGRVREVVVTARFEVFLPILPNHLQRLVRPRHPDLHPLPALGVEPQFLVVSGGPEPENVAVGRPPRHVGREVYPGPVL